MNEATFWPQKTRELQSRLLDSTIWNDFLFRNDDIIIATYGKTGTTWMQQIVGQLLFGGDPDLDVHQVSPWLDFRFTPKAVNLLTLEAQTHRRFIKTSIPETHPARCPSIATPPGCEPTIGTKFVCSSPSRRKKTTS